MITLSSTGISGSLMRICSSAETRNKSWVKGTPLGNLVVPPVYRISAGARPPAPLPVLCELGLRCCASSLRRENVRASSRYLPRGIMSNSKPK